MVEDRDPHEILESVLQDLKKAEKEDTGLDAPRVFSWRENLEIVQRQIFEMGREGLFKQTGIILAKDKDSSLALVACEGAMRFEVQTKRLRPDELKTGQAVTIAPDFYLRDKTIRFQKQFLGQVGAVGRITRVISQDNATYRLECNTSYLPRPFVGISKV